MSKKQKSLLTELTREQCAWLAGVIDSSGYFAARRDEDTGYLRCRFALTGRRDLLEIAHNLFAGGKIIHERNNCHRWELWSKVEISRLIDLVQPYLQLSTRIEQVRNYISETER